MKWWRMLRIMEMKFRYRINDNVYYIDNKFKIKKMNLKIDILFLN